MDNNGQDITNMKEETTAPSSKHEQEEGALSTANQANWPDTVQETCQIYDDWARTYDDELKKFGYNAPIATVNALEQCLPKKDCRILDVACGTGLIGKQLVERNYTCMDGIDISEESIKVCKEKGIYQRLLCDAVGTNRLDIESDTYNAVVCVGCFIPSHINQSCFPELVRITKPGGFILITMKQEYFTTAPDFNEGKFEGAIQDLVQKGIWQVVARNPFEHYFGQHSGITLVFQLL